MLYRLFLTFVILVCVAAPAFAVPNILECLFTNFAYTQWEGYRFDEGFSYLNRSDYDQTVFIGSLNEKEGSATMSTVKALVTAGQPLEFSNQSRSFMFVKTLGIGVIEIYRIDKRPNKNSKYDAYYLRQQDGYLSQGLGECTAHL